MTKRLIARNLIADPSFEGGLGGWQERGANDSTLEHAVGEGFAGIGRNAARLTTVDGAPTYAYGDAIPVTEFEDPTQPQTFSIYAQADRVTTKAARASIEWRDDADTLLEYATGPSSIAPTDSPERYAITSTPPEGATVAIPRFDGTGGDIDPGASWLLDGAMFHGGEEPLDYFDGDSTRTLGITYEWEGVRHASASRMLTVERSPITVYPAPEPRVARVIAERIRTGEILSWDVPLLDGTSSRELSGPGGINGWIGPVDSNLLGPDGLPLIREWSTALYHEVGGQIRAAGIVARFEEDEDGKFVLEAPGFSTYPHGIIHNKTYSPGLGCDALTAYRHFWSHVQSFPDADLGVTVDTLLSGEVLDETVTTTGKDKKRGYRVPWFEFRDCGSEMDQLLEVASADFIERHGWNAGHTGFTHHIELGVPRLGKKRSDLRFVEGENIIEAVPLKVDGDEFAQTIIGVGRGEGRKIVHTEVAHRDDRLRRTAMHVDKTASTAKIKRLANREYHRRNDTKGFDSVVIRDHGNARISDIDPGDDVLIEAELQWHGRVRLWNRVISIEQAISDDDVAILHVARSDIFRY